MAVLCAATMHDAAALDNLRSNRPNERNAGNNSRDSGLNADLNKIVKTFRRLAAN